MEGSKDYSRVVYSETEATNAVWVLTCAAMVFFMQCGFALLECGSVRAKNSTSILIKNLFNICIGCLGFWLIGYAFAFGKVHTFIGFDSRFFAGNGFEDMPEDNYLQFVFYVAFSLTSSTIVLGALAERTKLLCYIIYSFIHTSILYPVVMAWTQEGGWLYEVGYYDFAGTSTVFLVGGVAGLCGTVLLGERLGRDNQRKSKDEPAVQRPPIEVLDSSLKYQRVIQHVNLEFHDAFKEWLANQTNEFRPHNQTFIVTGALIVSVGWLFFNGGSSFGLFEERANAPPKIIMNTLISGCTSSVISVYIKPQVLGTYSFVSRYDCVASCGGFLAGLVAVSGCADELEPWFALLIGVISSLIYILGCKILDLLHIDDPIEAVPVNLFCGVWGTLATAFFDNERGLVSSSDVKWTFLGYQILGMLAIMLWSAAISTGFFYTMKRLDKFRIDASIELIGLDYAEMGGLSGETLDKIRRDGILASP